MLMRACANSSARNTNAIIDPKAKVSAMSRTWGPKIRNKISSLREDPERNEGCGESGTHHIPLSSLEDSNLPDHARMDTLNVELRGPSSA